MVTGVILEDGSILWDAEVVDGLENEEIQIVASQTISSDYVKGSLQAQITYNGTLSQITVNGKEVTARVGENGVYIIEYEVTENGSYTIMARDENGDYQKEIVKVTDITEDMEIWNRADMESFRDKVNSGRTFEGRTARVMADIDLEGSEGNQWVPIGTTNTNFKGIFDGRYHTIYHLYINNTAIAGGLFENSYGTIKNIVISEESNIFANSYTGAIVKENYGTISRCINNATIKVSENGSAGIAGGNSGIIEECINNGTIVNNAYNCAGICSFNGSHKSGTVRNCYNTGTIQGNQNVGGITGNNGDTYYGAVSNIDNCYNIGNISGYASVGGIVGAKGNLNINNTFWLIGKGANYGIASSSNYNANGVDETTLKTYDSTLGEAFVRDIQNLDGTWKYNNGYPILKWQMEK